MKKQKLWYGYLEAGNKSSPVIIDHSMDTGEKHTVFVYNHNKNEISKYVRELVEPKLRELTDKEKGLESALRKGFSASLKTLKYPLPKTYDAPSKDSSAPKVEADTASKEPEEDISDLGVDDVDWEDDND